MVVLNSLPTTFHIYITSRPFRHILVTINDTSQTLWGVLSLPKSVKFLSSRQLNDERITLIPPRLDFSLRWGGSLSLLPFLLASSPYASNTSTAPMNILRPGREAAILKLIGAVGA